MSEEKDWKEAWKTGKTGWHRNEYSSSLLQNFGRLELKENDTLFLPLCGASLDMAWALKQGYKVIGAELCSMAIERFFNENELTFEKIENTYIGQNIQIFNKNIFELSKDDLKEVNAVFDRAAMVALNAETRSKYIMYLKELLPQGTKHLLEVLEYDQNLRAGPPFSVTKVYLEQEASKNNYRLEALEAKDLKEFFPELASMQEKIYLLT